MKVGYLLGKWKDGKGRERQETLIENVNVVAVHYMKELKSCNKTPFSI